MSAAIKVIQMHAAVQKDQNEKRDFFTDEPRENSNNICSSVN